MQLIEAGQYTSACSKLEEVVRLVPDGVGAQLTLAECYEISGRLASAWSAYLLAESSAAREQQSRRRRLARKSADALRPRLAQMVLDVPRAVTGLPGITITCDGTPVLPGRWGEPFPVDRGEHVIVARADGRVSWEEKVVVPSDGVTVRATVGTMPPAAEPAVKEKASGATKPPPPPVMKKGSGTAKPLSVKASMDAEAAKAPTPRGAAAHPTRADGDGWFGGAWGFQKKLAAVAGGMGAMSIGIGIGASVVAVTKRDESHAYCRDGDLCDAKGIALRAGSRTAADLAAGALIAGALSLAGGVTLFATAPDAGRGANVRVAVGAARLDAHVAW
ncbi:hypothetical protein WMF31_36535 [Sorangium sp. So ce1036]|uniref:hypothetical protein n=1 Tax=Sorangium sp. So ce1036 TaxID=3133328 RepID=UPI003F0B6910